MERGNRMLNQELLEVRKFREEVKRDYSEYQSQLHNYCLAVCLLENKEESLPVLRAMAYMCVKNISMNRIEYNY